MSYLTIIKCLIKDIYLLKWTINQIILIWLENFYCFFISKSPRLSGMIGQLPSYMAQLNVTFMKNVTQLASRLKVAFLQNYYQNDLH
jgi:hypothetical protein